MVCCDRLVVLTPRIVTWHNPRVIDTSVRGIFPSTVSDRQACIVNVRKYNLSAEVISRDSLASIGKYTMDEWVNVDVCVCVCVCEYVHDRVCHVSVYASVYMCQCVLDVCVFHNGPPSQIYTLGHLPSISLICWSISISTHRKCPLLQSKVYTHTHTLYVHIHTPYIHSIVVNRINLLWAIASMINMGVVCMQTTARTYGVCVCVDEY